MRYCKRCLYNDQHPLSLIIDDEGICSACTNFDHKSDINWEQKRDELEGGN